MSATFHTLPTWKKDSTPAEWLGELVGCALARPEQWQRIVVVFEEVGPKGGSLRTRSLSYNCETNTLIIGTLATAQQEVFEEMKGRR